MIIGQCADSGACTEENLQSGATFVKGSYCNGISFFKDCMNGICEVASRYDYDILICMVEEDVLSQLQRLEANRKVDGMILSRALENSRTQKYLKSCQVPFVVIGPCKDREIPSVDNENQRASEEMTSIMLMKGSRKLALLGGAKNYSVTKS